MKNKWLYAVLGVASYYISQAIGGFIIAIIYMAITHRDPAALSNWGVNLLALPFGIAGCYFFHLILKREWRKNSLELDINILGEDVVKNKQESLLAQPDLHSEND